MVARVVKRVTFSLEAATLNEGQIDVSEIANRLGG